jgi:hydrogen cyanide synthase HcnC
VSTYPEVVVVGGGVIGWAVAYELARRAVRVLVVDRSLPGRATSASAGGLWPVGEAVGLGCGVIYHATRSDADAHTANGAGPEPLPPAFRDFLVRSNACFPALARELHDLTGVDIEYAEGAGLLFLVYDDQQWAFVESVGRALTAGMRLERLTPDEALRIIPELTRDLCGAVLLPGEHQVNPMLLAEAFKRGALRHGAAFRPDTLATGFRRQGNRVVGVEVGNEFLPCGQVVNAAGSWASRLAATAGLDLPVVPVRGQIVLTETLPRLLNACITTSTCYLAQKTHGEVLIGSTTEHAGFDVSVTAEAVASLCRGAARAIPLLGRVNVKRTWAGLRPGTPDELPILGPVSGVAGYLNATGGFRTGIVASPLTGSVVAQLVCGEVPSVPVEPFLAERFRRPSTGGNGEVRTAAQRTS